MNAIKKQNLKKNNNFFINFIPLCMLCSAIFTQQTHAFDGEGVIHVTGDFSSTLAQMDHSGTGTTILSADNGTGLTNSTTFNVADGALQANHDNAFGTANLTLNGGSLYAGAAIAISNPILVSANGGTICGSGYDVTDNTFETKAAYTLKLTGDAALTGEGVLTIGDSVITDPTTVIIDSDITVASGKLEFSTKYIDAESTNSVTLNNNTTLSFAVQSGDTAPETAPQFQREVDISGTSATLNVETPIEFVAPITGNALTVQGGSKAVLSGASNTAPITVDGTTIGTTLSINSGTTFLSGSSLTFGSDTSLEVNDSESALSTIENAPLTFFSGSKINVKTNCIIKSAVSFTTALS